MDGAYRLRRDGQAFAEIAYAFDRRPFRLHGREPAGDGLHVIGVVDPAHLLPRRPERWWIDVDAAGCLVHSALVRRAASEVFEGTKVRRFDWSRHGYGPTRRVPENGTIGGRPVHVVEGRFGVIAAPGAAVRLGFAAAAGRTGASTGSTTPSPSSRAPAPRGGSRRAAGRSRLRALAGSGRPQGRRHRGRRIAVASAKDGLRFEETDARVLAAGDRVILGPLVLAFRPQGGSAS